jgi:hypothetical protein
MAKFSLFRDIKMLKLPVTLYIKRHDKTGMMYFGKTTKTSERQIQKYLGSGDYWKDHLIVHGKNVTHVWHMSFQTEVELVDFALFFSEFFNIVHEKTRDGKKKWANLKPENGLDGGQLPGHNAGEKNPMYGKPSAMGMLGKTQTAETRKLQGLAKTGNKNPNFGKKYTEEERKKFSSPGESHPMYGKKHSSDSKKLMSENHADVTGDKNPMYGKNHSEVTKQKMSVPKTRICRLFDKKEMSVNYYARWLNSAYSGVLRDAS